MHWLVWRCHHIVAGRHWPCPDALCVAFFFSCCRSSDGLRSVGCDTNFTCFPVCFHLSEPSNSDNPAACMQNMEDVDELVDLPPAPDHILSGAEEPPAAGDGGEGVPGHIVPTAQLRGMHERALRRIGVIYAPLQHCHAFRHEAEVSQQSLPWPRYLLAAVCSGHEPASCICIVHAACMSRAWHVIAPQEAVAAAHTATPGRLYSNTTTDHLLPAKISSHHRTINDPRAPSSMCTLVHVMRAQPQ